MSDAKSADGSKVARGRKTKTPQDLDLSASDVREIASEAAVVETPPPAESVEPAGETPVEAQTEIPVAESATEAPAPPEAPLSEASPMATPATPSRALPAVIGLVAGLVGGIGGGVLAPQLGSTKFAGALGLTQSVTQPAGPDANTALNERLARTEAALLEAKTREDGLRRTLESLETRTLSLAQPLPDLDALKGRLGALEGESKVLPKEVGVLGSRVETLQPKLDTLEKTVETLNGRMAAVGSKDALALANGRMAAQSLLEDEFGAGKPYAATLDLIARTGGEASLIALVRPFAEQGAPAPRALLADFIALKPRTPAVPAGESGFMDRAKKAALSLVEVRRTGDIAGKDDEAVFARTQAALSKADLAAAFAASSQLSPGMVPAFAPWRTRLEARIKAGEAVGLLRKDAQTALARAAASAK